MMDIRVLVEATHHDDLDTAQAAKWAASLLPAGFTAADALVVVTASGGSYESVDFWAAARETGLAFASPKQFPWTLANSPAGQIALELDFRGPVFTIAPGDGWHSFVDEIAGSLGTEPAAVGVVCYERSRGGRTSVEAHMALG